MRDFDKLGIKITASFLPHENYEIAGYDNPLKSFNGYRFSFSIFPYGEVMDEIRKHVLLSNSQYRRIFNQMKKVITSIFPICSSFIEPENISTEITIENGASKYHYEWQGKTPAELSPFEGLIEVVRKIAQEELVEKKKSTPAKTATKKPRR